jgi:uncharacterized membrane protein
VSAGRGTQRAWLEFNRLTNLADGIFAVAMTFLCFTIQIPAPGKGPHGELGPRLIAMLPQLSALTLSFFLAARYWYLHYRMHAVLRRGDGRLVLVNMVLLFGVVLLPFGTDILGTYPLSTLSVAIYALNMALIASMMALIWRLALLTPGLLQGEPVRRHARRSSLVSLMIVFAFLVSIAVSWINPYGAIICWATVPLILAHRESPPLDLPEVAVEARASD